MPRLAEVAIAKVVDAVVPLSNASALRTGHTGIVPRIVFTPSGLDAEVEEGVTVLDAARRLGVDLDSVCGGRGICGRCQITPSVGNFPKWNIEAKSESLTPRGEGETNYRGKRKLEEGNRLGCMAKVCGDVVIDVPAASQVHRQIVRKDVNLGGVIVDPHFVLLYIEVKQSQLGDDVTAEEEVCRAVAEQHGRPLPTLSPTALRRVHKAIEKGDGGATVAIPTDSNEIVAIWPGFVDSAYGVAIDIGSTTVAGHLIELFSGEVLASSGTMNPQIRFGEDLMSRVSYVMMNPGGDVELTSVIRQAVNSLVDDLVEKASVDISSVLEIAMVGNPIMHHILLGIDPTPLGAAPFILATDQAVHGRASDIGLMAPSALYYVGPCIAGHVGADTAAAILAEGPHRGDAMQLLVDVGTNAEIVLGDRTKQFAASSPTGPAFEGAQLSSGQRATAGAIEKVRIDPTTLEPRFKVIGIEPWSDEAGFTEALEKTPITGVCGSGIIEVMAEMYLVGIISQDGVIQGSLRERTSRIIEDERTFSYVLYEHGSTRLLITQNDIRAIQLAKAALRAGIDLLVEHAGNPPLSDIRLAGAFGAHIDPVYAMVLGLVPDCPREGVRSVGNAAGVGAAKALLSMTERREMETAVRGVTKIETATEPRFQELFVNAMAFPHATAPTPNLETLVTLPPKIAAAPSGEGRRRRRG